MRARRAVVTGLTGGLMLLGPLGSAAWADDTSGGAAASPAASEPAPSDGPTSTEPAPPPDQPTDAPTDTPTDEPTDPGTDPVPDDSTTCSGVVTADDPGTAPAPDTSADPAADPAPDPQPGDGCLASASGPGGTGSYGGYGAVEKDGTVATLTSSAVPAAAGQLPRTGVPVGLLALMGLGLVALGGTSVVVGRARATS
jgi:hypothetical protein